MTCSTTPKRHYNLYEPAQRDYRIKYAAQCIKRGLVQGQSRHFETCFEMDDGDDVAIALLQRGLRDAAFREALYESPLVGLYVWINSLHPEFASPYAALDQKYIARNPRFVH
jgi:hypothetical protein